MAPDSPILQRFHQASHFVFGERGTPPFFGVLFIFGIVVLLKGHLIRLLTKQSIILLVLVSAGLNFPVLDDATKNAYQDRG